MNIIIDLILVAIIVISVFFAAKKGLIGTLFSLLGTVIAIVLSIALSGPVSGFINDNFVCPSVKNYIVGVMDSSSVGKSYNEAINNIDVASVVKSMPDGLEEVLELAGVNTEEIILKAENTLSDSQNAKDALISSIAEPISGTISTVIALVGLFIVLNIVLWLVSKIITAVTKAIPFGKTFNTVGGIAFGLVRGLIIVFVVSILFTAVSKTIDPESNNVFSQKTIDSTIVLKTLSDVNPISLILNVR